MTQIKTGLAALAFAGLITTSHAIDIVGTSPTMTIHATIDPAIKTQIEAAMNTTLKASFDQTIADAKANLAGFKEQKELAHGFGNANAYAVHSGSLSGYQNYDLFAVSAGLMVGFQAPSTDLGYASKIGDEITENGDIYAGLGLGASFINLGINAGFITEGLYLSLKYGGMERDFGDFAFEFSVMGVGANYRLFEPKSLAGIIKWRGISAGTGFYVQSNKIDFLIEGETIDNSVPFRNEVIAAAPSGQETAYGDAMTSLGFDTNNPDVNMGLTPAFNMGLDVTTMTLPIEASTAVSLLFGVVNVSAGAGVDVNFGSSEIVLKGLAKANTESPDSTKVSFSDANVTIDGSSKDGPSFIRPRLTAGVGLGLGPVKLDIPVAWYLSSGAAFGLTVAVVW